MRVMARSAGILLQLGVLILCAAPCFSQTQVLGTISGIITDNSGAVIPAVRVTLTNKATGQTGNATTNDSGYYAFPNLEPGSYDVVAEKEGFQRCANTGIVLDAAGRVESSCSLQVGQITQTIEVQAQTLEVQTEEAKVSRIIDPTQIQEIPANGRNFASLLALQPGVVQSFSFNSFQGMSLFSTQCTHVNGQRGDANNIQIEGAPSTRTRANGAIVAAPSIDAIGEINVVTSGYMPEYSRGAGGQILLQVKSGTRQYHGGAYEFLRNDALDARNFFASSVSQLKFNNFGYNVGGPVIPHKDKLFFFWSQEWGRIRTSSTDVTTVPTVLARQGNFSEYCAAGLPCPKVPNYLNGVDGLVAGQPFPGDTIPQSLWSPNGSAMLDLSAMPTTGGVGPNFSQQIPSPQNERKETLKADAELDGIKSHLAVTLRHYTQDALPSWGTSGSSQLLQINPVFPERGGTADLTTNFSPTLLNDFTFASSEDIVHVNLNLGTGLSRGNLGVNYPYIFGDLSKDIAGKIPTVNITGFDTVSGLPYPSGSVGKVFTFQDVLTNVRGSHIAKVGVWVEQDGENDHDQVRVTPGSAGGIGNNLNGTFTFGAATSNPASTGAPLADAILGNFDSYSELGFRNFTPWVARQVGVFGQDSWKVTPRLTIQGGLRWDYFPPYHSRWCNFSSFNPISYSRLPGIQQTVDPATGDVTGGDPYNGISVPCSQLPTDAVGHFAVFGQELTSATYGSINQELRNDGLQRGLSPEIFAKHYNNWQPRLGFAWDPFGKGTTSIRAGAGVFYNHFTLSDVTLMGGNSPFQLAAESLNGRADCPGQGSALGAGRGCSQAGAAATVQLPIPITGGDLLSKVPSVYTWNATVQHMFPQDTLVEVGYVGTRANHLVVNSDLNQLPVGTTFANPGVAIPALAPYPGIGGATVGLNDSNSKYDSLQVSVQRRLNKGLQYGVAYTYSHSYDFGSDLYANAVDTYNLGYNYGRSNFDLRNNLIINYVYDLPFFRGQNNLVAQGLGGWELAGVVAFQSGFPNTITNASSDEAGAGEDFGQTANLVSGCDPNSGPGSVAQFFKTSCFTEATRGTFGPSARNLVTGPGTRNWDFALYKNGPITERFRYQFRAEFFNVLNHPSFNAISTGLGNGNFGQVTGANDPREIQFGLKLSF
jgi:hypothetical protein